LLNAFGTYDTPLALCGSSSGVGPVFGGVGRNALFKAREGQGHQRHYQPAGALVPQREYPLRIFKI